MKKYILIIVSILVLLAILLFLTPSLLGAIKGKDVIAVDDDNLIPPPPSDDVSKNINIYYDLEKMEEELDLSVVPEEIELYNDYLNIEKFSDDEFNNIAAKNWDVFLLYDSTKNKNLFQIPASIIEDGTIINTHAWRQATQLMALKSLYSAQNGHYEEALDDVFKIIGVGDAIESSQSNSLIYSIGLSIKEMGFLVMEKVLSLSDFSSEEINEIQDDFSKYNIKNNTYPFKLQYFSRKEEILKINDGTSDFIDDVNLPLNDYYFKPNKTIGYYYETYSETISEFEKSCDEWQEVKQMEVIDDIDSFLDNAKLYFTENAIGKIIYKMSLISHNSVKEKQCEIEVVFDRLVIMINDKLEETIKKENADSDSDGLLDVDEKKYGTDINNQDTDGDGYADGDEVDAGYNPNGEGTLSDYLEKSTWEEIAEFSFVEFSMKSYSYTDQMGNQIIMHSCVEEEGNEDCRWIAPYEPIDYKVLEGGMNSVNDDFVLSKEYDYVSNGFITIKFPGNQQRERVEFFFVPADDIDRVFAYEKDIEEAKHAPFGLEDEYDEAYVNEMFPGNFYSIRVDVDDSRATFALIKEKNDQNR